MLRMWLSRHVLKQDETGGSDRGHPVCSWALHPVAVRALAHGMAELGLAWLVYHVPSLR
jgi:hypothetical protein